MEGGWGHVTSPKRHSDESHTQDQPRRPLKPCLSTELSPHPALPPHTLSWRQTCTDPPTHWSPGLGTYCSTELSFLICSSSFKTQIKCHHSLHLRTIDVWLLHSPDWAKLRTGAMSIHLIPQVRQIAHVWEGVADMAEICGKCGLGR